MPTEWTRVRLGDLVSISHGWPFKSDAFTEARTGGPIVVSIGNFRYSGGFRFDSTTIKEYTAEYPKEYELTPGEILLVMTCQTPSGEILGIPGRVPDDGNTYLHNQRLGRVVIKDRQQIDPGFVYYLSLWSVFNRELCTSATGTKILHTAPSRIEAFKFDLPSLPEQRAIASVLGALDDKIDLNRRMCQTLEEIARALFTSWFVDFDPVRAKMEGRNPGLPKEIADLFPSRLVDSERGPIPEGWTAQPLDEVADFLNGLALQKYPPLDGVATLPVLKIAQLKRGDTSGADRCSAEVPAPYRVVDGDLIFSWSGSLEVALWTGGAAALNQHLFKVTSGRFPRWCLYQWVCQHLPEFRQIAADKATTMGHIQRRHLSAARVAVPADDVRRFADATLGPMTDRILAARTESRKLASLRDTLLPKLISGELRVPASLGSMQETST
jgi:type I restriction enzyme, S subunit